MNNNLILQLKNSIKNLEDKLNKTKNLKSKLELLHEISTLKSQLTELLELEHKSIEAKYESVNIDKIKDINKQIEKASKRGKFMTDYFYNLEKEAFINDSDYLKFIDKFWIDIMADLDPKQNVMVRFLIQMSDTSARTLSKTEILVNTPECLNSFKEIIKYNLNNIYSHYLLPDEDNMILGFVMRYKIISKSNIKETVTKKAFDIKKGRIQRTVKIRNINYPLSTNTIDFGNIQYKVGNLTIVLDNSKNLKFEFDRKEDSQIIKVYKNEKLINTLIDSFIDLDNNLFKRTVNNLSYYIKNGNVILKTKEYSPKFISKSKFDKTFTENIYTADIETLTKLDSEGRRYFEPYSVAFYDGINSKSYYVTDYSSSDEMMNVFFKDLFDLNLKNTDIYFHNLSGFDINFILKPLLNMKRVESEIMLREDKFIQIKIKYGKSSFNIKDSLLILPGSLMNLSKSFKIETPKEIFPRKLFENETFPADFISNYVPDYNKYFNKSEVSLEDYNKYCSLFEGKSWSLKTETLKYVDIDCIALHQILIKFGNMIFDMWGIDIKHTPTLPALCFKIYRSKYMAKDTIPIITGIPYRDIKQSYTGGSTDMYVPYGKNLYHYDVNSLYPTSMFKFDMPIGNIKQFTGNILEIMDKPFGFFRVKVTSPDHLDNPILQIRYNDRTISPLGTFTGWYFSEELFNAQKYGYKFEILEGYLFEKENIFKDYVSVLHQMKQNSEKSSPLYLIAKLLMNSLYGKFGMTDNLATHIISNTEKLDKIIDSKDKITSIELDDDLYLVSYHEINENKLMDDYTEFDISIGIASSITAYSRIIMTQFKNLPDNLMYYTDTDSAVMEKPLDDSLVGKHLGQMVHERTYKEFVALAPKVYGGLLENGKELTKVKGFKNSVTFEDLKSLLDENKSLELQQTKWFRFIGEGSISIKNQVYRLAATSNKRKLVYKNNKLIGTEAFVLEDYN